MPLDPLTSRRYLTRFDSTRVGHVFCDVLIIGAGVAGLRAALKAADAGADVLVLCKGSTTQSSTQWAQGGVAAAIKEPDVPAAHFDDTIAVGAGLCDEAAVRTLVEKGPAEVRQLVEWGCPFDRESADPGSPLSLTREGGHTAYRVLHALGDATGKAISQTLNAVTAEHDGIRVFDNCFVVDLVTDRDGVCRGAITHHEKYGHQIMWARQTILAGGGCGVVYRETTNPDVATGDGHAMAYRAGATLRDMEFVQFHPTTLYVAGASRVLISEAVRGEGGLLVRRDVVSRAILSELVKHDATSVYLDVRHFPPGSFAERFPKISKFLAKFDIDPQTDLIPIRPSAHYMIGGVRTDAAGRSDVPGLFAVGECASTGVHGANRLASNSLLEGLVFGSAAGDEAAKAAAKANGFSVPKIRSDVPESDRTELDVADIRSSLRSVMWRNLGIVRTEGRMTETTEILDFWSRYTLDKVFDAPREWELQNLILLARLITQAAITRRESRGTHHRDDYPDRDDDQWQYHIELRRGMNG